MPSHNPPQPFLYVPRDLCSVFSAPAGGGARRTIVPACTAATIHNVRPIDRVILQAGLGQDSGRTQAGTGAELAYLAVMFSELAEQRLKLCSHLDRCRGTARPLVMITYRTRSLAGPCDSRRDVCLQWLCGCGCAVDIKAQARQQDVYHTSCANVATSPPNLPTLPFLQCCVRVSYHVFWPCREVQDRNCELVFPESGFG